MFSFYFYTQKNYSSRCFYMNVKNNKLNKVKNKKYEKKKQKNDTKIKKQLRGERKLNG